MSTPAGALYPTVVHACVQAGLISAGLASWALHFDPVHLCDIYVTCPIVFANIGLGCIKSYRSFKEVFTPKISMNFVNTQWANFLSIYLRFTGIDAIM